MNLTLLPEAKVLDEKAGIMEYIASDESVDSQQEIVRADGWQFDRMQKNAPFVDSHRYGTVGNLLGKVIDFRVSGRQLIETVQWAIDVAENTLAKAAFAMTKAGYLKAVSVGFKPEVLATTNSDPDTWPPDWNGAQIFVAQTRTGRPVWDKQMSELNVAKGRPTPETIYLRQQQLELSACIVGSNPNAVAKSIKLIAAAHKAGVLSEDDLEMISTEAAKSETVNPADGPDAAELTRRRARMAFLWKVSFAVKQL